MTTFTANKKISFTVSITIMILAGMFGLLATDIYAPSLPIIPQLFHTSTQWAQLTVTVFIVALSFAQLIAGMLSDIYGRRRIFIIGLTLFCSGTIVCISAQSILFLLLGRIIQGIGAGAVTVLSRILLRDLFSGVKMAKIGSYLAVLIVLSPAIAPIIGGFIQQSLGFKAIFIFLLIFAGVLFYLVQFYLPETNHYQHLHSKRLKTILKKYQQVITHKIFLVNIIATGCGLGMTLACAIVNPFLLQNKLQLMPAQYGTWAFIAMLGMPIGMIINGCFVGRLDTRFIMYIGLIITTSAGLSLIICSQFYGLSIQSIIIPTFFISLAAAFILPNAVVNALTPFPEMVGTAGALYGCLQMLIASTVTAIISVIELYTQAKLGLLITSLAVLSLGVFYFGDIRKEIMIENRIENYEN